MNLLVVIPILLVIAILALRKVGPIAWLFAWWIALFVWLQFGFSTPVPQSVVGLYMGVFTLALLLYISADRERFQSFREAVLRFSTEKKYTLPLALVVLAIPTAVAANVYLKMTSPAPAPFFGRTIHPANPPTITVHETGYDLSTLDNPLRPLETSDAAAFRRHVDNGRKIYYENCFYCHGDNMKGNGHFAFALNPVPTNLVENINILQESFLFWRIAKGAPGLPTESGPWESAMPAWEDFLTAEEIWEVVLFLYDFTGLEPRARQEVH